jgi:two-component system nitrogen regulation sensor histidine kinase GlnL
MFTLEGLINNLDEVVCWFDQRGSLAFINKAGEEFFGRSLRELRNRSLSALFAEMGDLEMLLQKTLTEGRLYNCRQLEVDVGRIANVDLTLTPFYTADVLEGAILSIRENLSLSERDDYQFDSLLYLLGSIAHEIRNPLSGIRGAAQILGTKPPESEADECVGLIIKETDRLNSILQGYLTMTRSSGFHELNIHEIIEHALRLMKTTIRDGKIAVEKSYDPSLPAILGDESKLLQVIINLVKNSLEAMQESDEKTLSVTTRLSDEYVVIYEQSGPRRADNRVKKQRWVVVNFQDTGVGIAKDDLARIFLPLYTKKERGSGLGLALSRKIIKDHGGIIRVKSAPGSGACFSIYLPLPLGSTAPKTKR